MGKVLSPDQLSTLLDGKKDGQETGLSLEDIVTPTANDLLALTEAAIGDVKGFLPLTDDQREALHAALKQRLMGTLSEAPETSPEFSPDEAL